MVLRLVFAFVFLGPLACVVGEVVRTPTAWQSWREADRVMLLLANTALLALAAVLIAVPLGTLLGVATERVPFPGRRFVRGVLLLALFVPLPVYAVAWQIVLGSWLPPLTLEPGEVAWRPWNQGLLPAAWVHGMAAVPWVAWIVAAGLRHTDRDLEDEATMTGGPTRLFRHVLLPRVALAVAASAGFVVAQTATEIAVTDPMMVRTFAEEVYTQLVGFPAGVAAAVAVTLPVWLAACRVAVLLSKPLVTRFFPTESVAAVGRPLAFRRRWLPAALAWIATAVTALLPLAALLWKAGTTAGGWSLGNLGTQVERTVTLSGVSIASGALSSALTGLLTASLAAWFCWANRERPTRVIAAAVTLALTPGPLIGLGLKELIGHLLTLEECVLNSLGLSLDFPPVRSALYDQPSPLPGVWACAIRFFPVAVAILYPAVRVIPKELHETAKLDGVRPWRYVGWPLTRSAFGAAAVAVAVLSLGEVSASKLVVPPHLTVYVLDLFNQMHYGTEATVAAMCLVQVAVTGLIVYLAREI
ncbi:ABC transporter permease [Limnoglobus roseus]|uniref:Iron ABC transporter permease n=1 Tax=Limnoglobus roseus TaxID=2598579 RepID=A0A5C1AQS1_9BACT|nr:ABC transporter permease subunit [Limnoglobus roseus]QEL20965.1 iron ABC transporter permease [Limnoglobus roseus]